MGIVASRRKRRALHRQLSALATGYFTNRQIKEFRDALGPDPISRDRLFEYLNAQAMSEHLQRSIVRECSHGDSEDSLNFADFLNARVVLEQRYSEDAMVHCRNILLNSQGLFDVNALHDIVQFAAGGPSACTTEAAATVAIAMAQPAQAGGMEPENAVIDIFERCPALLKVMQKLLADASSLPWIPPPKMHVLTSGVSSEGPPAEGSAATTSPKTSNILSPEWTWLLAGELEGSCLTAWLRVFCASEDGWSVNRFLEAAADLGPTLLVVRDTRGAVFGCYAPESWSEHGDFYGDEGLKAFVFQLEPHAAVYRASGHTNSVQWCCRRSSFLPNGIGIGGIQRAQALFLAEDLSSGHSRATVAFANPPMGAGPAVDGGATSIASAEGEGYFVVAEVECWALSPAAVGARAAAAAAEGDASVLEAHQKELAFLGITGRTAYSAGFRDEVPEEYKQQLRV